MNLRTILAVTLVVAGCDAASAPSAGFDLRSPSSVVAVVDSALAPEEHLRRFRGGLEPVHALDSVAPSRDALVEAWAEAIERQDTARLVSLHLTRAEFAYLYFPESPYAAPPARTPPEFLWFQFRENSEKGLNRAVRRLGGRPLELEALACAAPRPHGRSLLHERCTARRRTAEGLVEQRLFGTILERDGRFKFVSYANEF